MQEPIVSSQIPWLEQVPSSGQSNSRQEKIRINMFCNIFKILFRKTLLEQSDPCLPTVHKHCPVLVLQIPALLQSPGQVNSKIYDIMRHYGTICWL